MTSTLGKYAIIETIGKGATGWVYKAEDPTLERFVALKVLHPYLAADTDFLAWFGEEARILAKINHPNVVSIYEIGEAQGQIFIAMQYLSGGSLADKLKDGPLSLKAATKVVQEVSQGLSAGHAEGIIHRDVKPGNILFNQHGEAVVADFGLAKGLQSLSSKSVSSFGTEVGTPFYRAPELWSGSPAPSPSTDVYSLACVFFEMISGEKLFDGDTSPIVMKKHFDPLNLSQSWPDNVSPQYRKILEKALSKNIEERYASVITFARMLTLFDSAPDRKVAERSGSSQTRSGRLPIWILLGVVMLCLTLGIVGAVFGFQWLFDTDPQMTKTPLLETQAEFLDETVEPETTWEPLTAQGTNTVEVIEPTVEIIVNGDVSINSVDGAELVEVPAGEFSMGSDLPDAAENEIPVHTVWLDHYWIYRYEVTSSQYAEFLNMVGNQVAGEGYWLDQADHDVKLYEKNGQWVVESGYEQHPVIEVCWYGAQAYCEWASGRLPTEAEWEKAARGVDMQMYSWGDTSPTCELAQYDVCEGETRQIGSFPENASPYGALDMSGNVWEWVADWYDSAYYVESIEENPLGPESGTHKVVRGGSWHGTVNHLRTTFRGAIRPVYSDFDLGFRCVIDETSQEETSSSFLFFDDFTTDQAWVDESDGQIYRDEDNEWLVWKTQRDKTVRYYMPVDITAEKVRFQYDFKVTDYSGNANVFVGLANDLTWPGDPWPGINATGAFTNVLHDGATGDFVGIWNRYYDGMESVYSNKDGIPCDIMSWHTLVLETDGLAWTLQLLDLQGNTLGQMEGTHLSPLTMNYIWIGMDEVGGWESLSGYFDNIGLTELE